MVYKELTDYNTSKGVETLFIASNDATGGLFMGMILFAVFIITFMGSYFSQQRTGGKGNVAGSFAVAGLITTTISFFMTLIDGLINPLIPVICIVITVMGVLFLYIKK